MKQCITCSSNNIENVVEDNRILYYCKSCKTKNLRFNAKSNNFAAKEIDGNTVHISTAALIKKNNKYLFTNRNDYPFGFSLPVGHVYSGETIKKSLERKVLEETGLIVTKSTLICSTLFADCCKYGTDLHQWNIYECSVKGKIIPCFEVSEAKWIKKEDIEKLDLTAPIRYILSKINFIEKDYDLEERLSLDSYLSKNLSNNYTSIIRKIPFPVMIFNEDGILNKTSATAEKMLLALKNIDRYEYNLFMRNLTAIVKTSLRKKQDFTKELDYMGQRMRAIAGYSVKNEGPKEITISLEKIRHNEEEIKSTFAYQTSLALCAKSNHITILKSILRQMVTMFDLNSVSIMMKEKETLKTTIKICKDGLQSRKPLELKVGVGVAGWVAKNKKMLVVLDTSKNALFVDKANKPALSLLSIPVMSDNNVLAVLNLSKESGIHFTEDETRGAIMVSNRLALAIENKNLYESLQKDKKTLESVLGVTNPTALLDENLNIIFENLSAKQLFGNAQFITLFPEKELLHKFKKIFYSTLDTGKTQIKELKIKVAGKEKILKSTFSLLRDNNKKFVMIGSSDITQIRKREKTIHEQVQQITELFKITSMSTSGNEFFEKICERTNTLLNSKTTKILLYNDPFNLNTKNKNTDMEIKFAKKALENDTCYISNNTNKTFYNKSDYTKVIIAPLIIDKKTVGVIVSTNKKTNYNSQDLKLLSIIASRVSRRIESMIHTHEINENKLKLSSIIENTADGILVINQNNKIVIWNRAAEEITGFDNARNFLKKNRQVESYLYSAKEFTEKKMIVTNADNTKIWLEFILTKNKSEFENIDEYIVVIRDVTKEKNIELHQKEFIYTATHELRTPITAIKGYLSMIIEGDAGKINLIQKRYFERAYGASEKLNSLVEDLLNVARIDENRLLFDKTSFNISPLIDEILTEFRQKASIKNISLSKKDQANVEIEADIHKTKQALANLIDNAIKYTPPRGEIVVKINSSKNQANIEIIDNGVGIPKKDQHLVFNKFHRVYNSETIKAGGTGLGLFIVKNLIEKQGGKIDVDSKLGVGSTFKVALPLSK